MAEIVKKGTKSMGRYHYVFPKWSNMLLPAALAGGAIVPLYVVLVVAYGFSPETTDVGYQPHQPVPFSHKLHAGELGMDCRYCHNTVERANHAAIPPTQTCMNCHTQIHKDSIKIRPLLESYLEGTPVTWRRVHDLPDFVYFSHRAHVIRGVSCVECHGRIDRMEIVTQVKRLSMGWCLECHRAPDIHLRDPRLVTKLGWGNDMSDEDKLAQGTIWRETNDLNPSQDCSTCHR
ncbi:MAG: cytochrome c3 family protein [Planctomycetota bacterium]|nr:cytochrome c3 family protein [Planctomycetota bacterium]